MKKTFKKIWNFLKNYPQTQSGHSWIKNTIYLERQENKKRLWLQLEKKGKSIGKADGHAAVQNILTGGVLIGISPEAGTRPILTG